jgi:hypothetical protein
VTLGFDLRGGLAGEQVVRRSLEELHHRGVFEEGGVRDIDSD